MITDYDDDAKMLELGRRTARYRAINQAREKIRDYAVMLGTASNIDEIVKMQVRMNECITELADALSTGNPSVSELSE